MTHPIKFELAKPKKEFRARLKPKPMRTVKAVSASPQAPGNSWLLGGLGIRRRIF